MEDSENKRLVVAVVVVVAVAAGVVNLERILMLKVCRAV